jgi:hypothetical protein
MLRFVLPFVIALSLVSVGCSQSGTAEGVVEYKAIYGLVGKSYSAIVVAGSPDGMPHIVVYDEAVKDCLPSEGDLVVSDSLERRIEDLGYTKVEYIVSVRILSQGRPSQYLSGFRTNVQIFNDTKLGGKINFRYSPSKLGPEIVGLLE